MKYFLLYQDPLCTDVPVIQNWSGKIDPRTIMPGKSHEIPARQMLGIAENPYTVFTDVLNSPFLLLSKAYMDAVTLYEPQIVSKQIILLDGKNRKTEIYYLPILPHVRCLAEGSCFSPDRSVLKTGILNLERVKEHSIFHIADLTRFYTVVRLDLLESMLRRSMHGVGITELPTVEGEAEG